MISEVIKVFSTKLLIAYSVMLQRATITPSKHDKNLEPLKHEQRPYKIKRKKAGEAETILNN